MKWFDVSNEDHYIFSLRDLTTDTLLFNRVFVPQNSTYYLAPNSIIDPGHSFKWAVASVDSAGIENWTESFNTRIW